MRYTLLHRCILLCTISFLLLFPMVVFGQATESTNAADNINVELQVPLPFIGAGDGTVKNISEYIQGVYRFLIGAGALFAVIMMIVAGYQWIFSGGSSDKVGAGKKRMFNAAIGLMLALVSYIVLNTITPRLVQTRLPQVDAVPQFPEGADETSCTSSIVQAAALRKATGRPVLAESISPAQVATLTAYEGNYTSASQEVSLDNAYCGRSYNIASKSSQTTVLGRCIGTGGCNANEVCAQGQCSKTFLSGRLTWEGDTNRFVDSISLYALCKKEKPIHVKTISLSKYLFATKQQTYQFPIDWLAKDEEVEKHPEKDPLLQSINDCGRDANNQPNFLGFILSVQVNDDSSLVTIDDDYAIIKTSCSTTGGASIPLHNAEEGSKNVYDFDDLYYDGRYAVLQGDTELITQIPDLPITKAGRNFNAYQNKIDGAVIEYSKLQSRLFFTNYTSGNTDECNISITREHMPYQ